MFPSVIKESRKIAVFRHFPKFRGVDASNKIYQIRRLIEPLKYISHLKSKTLTIRYEYAIILVVIVMARRIAKLIVGKAGGTAGKDSKTYKVSLPSKWVAELGLADSKMEISFDGVRIMISPHLSMDEFIEKKKTLGHKLMIFKFYDGEVLCTKIIADFTDESLSVENVTENIVKTAFGKNETPTWNDFLNFLEERCLPRSRSGIREYLETIGVEEYDPLEIIKKTNGRMAEDNQWLKLEVIE